MKSVFITPQQVLENVDLLRGRQVGIVLFNGAPFDERKVARALKSGGAKFIGLSPAISLSPQGKLSLPVQMATLERSAAFHTLCCDETGTSPPYRLSTEPGRLFWDREERGALIEKTEWAVKTSKKRLPKDVEFEISQNEVSNPIVLAGFIAYLEWLAEKESVHAGIQTWLNRWATIAPGVVMGAVKRIGSSGISASISEFGVLAPSPPYPSHPDLIFDWEEWRSKRVLGWLLQSGISEEEAPYWGPLSRYEHGPYVHVPFASLQDFDAFYSACYRRIALTGGPVGVGTDFRLVAEQKKPKRRKKLEAP